MTSSTGQPIKEIAKRWRAARGYRGWSQRELADQLGINESTVKRYERGNAGSKGIDKHLDTVARLTGLPYEWFTIDLDRIPELAGPVDRASSDLAAELRALRDELHDLRADVLVLGAEAHQQTAEGESTKPGQVRRRKPL